PAPTLPPKYLVMLLCVPSMSRLFMSLITGTSTSSVLSLLHPIVTMRNRRRPSTSGTPHWKGSVSLSTSGLRYASYTAGLGKPVGRNSFFPWDLRNFLRNGDEASASFGRVCPCTASHHSQKSSSPDLPGNSERISTAVTGPTPERPSV